MNEPNEIDIGKLLRVKRYEQPPPGYFDNVLHEFHRRQRDELLREPLWRICLQRIQDFMFRLNVPGLTSYPAAITAVLLCAAIISLKIHQGPGKENVAAANQKPAVVADSAWSLSAPVATSDVAPRPLRNTNYSPPRS